MATVETLSDDIIYQHQITKSFHFHLVLHIYHSLLSLCLLVYYSQVTEPYLYPEVFVILYQYISNHFAKYILGGKHTKEDWYENSPIDTFIKLSRTSTKKMLWNNKWKNIKNATKTSNTFEKNIITSEKKQS